MGQNLAKTLPCIISLNPHNRLMRRVLFSFPGEETEGYKVEMTIP